ncbi:hypothetical protein F2P81_002814 [Scophthalmus maximus]|uniref:Protein SON-like n=1 Tax=Scophthalmus maximus TaxID=52904 RepID=A0A6A4TLX3_SCOMX|nr:hypothetical protein F2P81_002814 [Scophthalmus maximus]
MAANIEQIFQDFILSKIREIEDQNEDESYVDVVCCDRAVAGGEADGAEKAASERETRDDVGGGGVTQKKHKKHKKHKSKKKKRKRENEKESSDESEADGSKHQPRRGTPTEVNKEQGEEEEKSKKCHKRHSTGKKKKKKKKKKKRRRKSDDNSSDSDSECVSKQRDVNCAQSLSPRRREELPDIIPKQGPSKSPRPPQPASSSSHSGVRTEALTESNAAEPQNIERCVTPAEEKEEKSEEATQNFVTDFGTSQSTASKPDRTEEPGCPRLKVPETTRSPVADVKSPVKKKRKTSPQRSKDGKSSKRPKRSKSPNKEQLLEIAKANAAAMCAKAGMPIPASLRSNMLPLVLPSVAMNAAMASMTAATMTAALSNMGTLSSLLSLPSITNKPPPAAAQPNIAALEEVKRKVAKQANSISIKEFTDKCKMIVDSKGELPVAVPHVSDEEDDGKPFGGSALREQKAISFSINNTTVRPAVRSDAGMAKEFPVSSGCQHREGAAAPEAVEPPVIDSVFPDPVQQPVDISQAVTERIKAQRRLAENPYDVSAICMLSRAQEQVDAWAQSNTVPGLFTGSTGAQVLTSEELSNSGPQAWLKKDQFLRAAPVSGGVGEFLMRKMGWRTGEGLGRNREGTVEPIIIDFKVDRKGLVAEGEKPQKQTGGLVVTKDLMGKHPVSALIELCNKRRIMQPDFVMVHHSGPDHRKNFLFKVTVNGVDYQPQTASPNKKHAKAMAATVALQALGEVPVDGPGLYTGPVFTAASTGPLFST